MIHDHSDHLNEIDSKNSDSIKTINEETENESKINSNNKNQFNVYDEIDADFNLNSNFDLPSSILFRTFFCEHCRRKENDLCKLNEKYVCQKCKIKYDKKIQKAKSKKEREKRLVKNVNLVLNKPFSDKLNLCNLDTLTDVNKIKPIKQTSNMSFTSKTNDSEHIEIFKPIIRNNIKKEYENGKDFDWDKYLQKTKSKPVPEKFFSIPYPSNRNGFKVGMRLEGTDPVHESLICVLTVSQIQGHRIRLNFDGYDHSYDFWRNADSKFIFPVGYCKKNNLVLTPPFGYNSKEFEWSSYLSGKVAAPKHLFSQFSKKISNKIQNLEIGMKLEAVDKHNPIFIRVATVIDVKESYVKIHYDGWSNLYDVWFEKDSEDLHPIGWCEKSSHQLAKPLTYYKKENDNINNMNEKSLNSCPTFGCNGLGHIEGYIFATHTNETQCPYSLKNLNREILPDRLKVNNNLFKQKNTINGSYSENSISYNTISISSDQVQKYPKRGRPSKKFKQDLEDYSKELENIRLKEKLIELEKEIRESVYQTNNYEEPVEISKTILFKYNSQLVYGYEDFLIKNSSNAYSWSVEQVSKFIESIPGCETLAQSFVFQEIDGEALMLINLPDMIKLMKLKFGQALKIFNYISKLKYITSKCSDKIINPGLN